MNFFRTKTKKTLGGNIWARPEMFVTFRAEIMPGRSREQRTFRIKSVFTNGRVTLHDFVGEHREAAFEPVIFETALAE